MDMIHCAVEASMAKSAMMTGRAGDMTVWLSRRQEGAEDHDDGDDADLGASNAPIGGCGNSSARHRFLSQLWELPAADQ